MLQPPKSHLKCFQVRVLHGGDRQPALPAACRLQLSCEFATLDVSDAMGLVRAPPWCGDANLMLSQCLRAWRAGPLPAACSRPPAKPCPCALRAATWLGQRSHVRRAATAVRRPPALPQKRLNLTKTVRKQPITQFLGKVGAAVEDKKLHDPKYDEDHPVRGGAQRGAAQRAGAGTATRCGSTKAQRTARAQHGTRAGSARKRGARGAGKRVCRLPCIASHAPRRPAGLWAGAPAPPTAP